MHYRHCAAEDNFNSLEDTILLLETPDRKLIDAELAMLHPILKHINDSMCSGVAEDNNTAPGWMACVTQNPNKKVG